MKRFLSLILVLALLLTGCTVSRATDSDGTPVTFYYQARAAEQLGAKETVASETRLIAGKSLWSFFDLYFAGPDSGELVSPFPTGTRVVDTNFSGDTLTLKMSGEFFTLMGVEMSVACCCLVKTVCAYLGIDAVTLTDETESIRMQLHPGQYLLSNSFENDTDESFTVYFADSERRYLIAENRAATLSENETEMAFVMRKLMEGPESKQLHGIIPEGTELLGISCSDGICTVNFSHEFYENRMDNGYGAYTTIYGITNTLTALSGIEAVSFLVEGSAVEHYGVFPLDEPVSRNMNCIGPVRTASGELDVNIYVCSSKSEASFAVPCRVKQTISQPLALAVTSQLLSYEPPEGFYNPIPYGTELLNISVSGNVCYVDVSDKFVPQEDTLDAEQNAVWALVMTLTDLDNISSVVLTINGESSGLSYVDITEPLTKISVNPD